MNEKRMNVRRIGYRTLAVLLCLLTVFSLIQPGMTIQAEEYTCGYEEHVHTDDCYKTVTEMQPVKELNCTYVEPEGVHKHEGACYKVLDCDKPVVEPHIHGYSCYAGGVESAANLICTKKEAHVHDEFMCYSGGKLTCGKEEAHTHDEDACYRPAVAGETGILVCTEKALKPHEHDASCYIIENKPVKARVLDCSKTAHTHSALCTGEDTSKPSVKIDTTGFCDRAVDMAEALSILEWRVVQFKKMSSEDAAYSTTESLLHSDLDTFDAQNGAMYSAGVISESEFNALNNEFYRILDVLFAEVNPEEILPYGAIGTVSGNQGIKVKLFNYSPYINQLNGNFRNNAKYFKFRGDYKAVADEVARTGKTTADFIPVLAEGATDYWAIHDVDGFTAGHATVERTLKNGYPVQDLTRNATGPITGGYTGPGATQDDRSLDYLFGGEANSAVSAYAPSNTPLILDGSTHYYYNSATNGAYYDAGTNRFIVYDTPDQVIRTAATETTPAVTSNDFLPFNASTGSPINTTDIDYWFGMSMEISFVQTKDGMLLNSAGESVPMTFSFSGDDDVWVFVDNTLVLDLGGTHGTVKGEIDFSTGVIKQYLTHGGKTEADTATSFPTTLWDCFHAANTSPNGGWTTGEPDQQKIFNDYTKHTLKFFYLERATAYANCMLDFNLETVPDYTLNVTKNVVAANGKPLMLNNLDYKFRVLKKGSTDLYVTGGTQFNIRDASNAITGTGTVGADGIFTLKAGQTAEFANMIGFGQSSGQYEYVVQEVLDGYADSIGQVKINGSPVNRTVSGSKTVVASGVYRGDQNVSVLYTNTAEVGTLKVTKDVWKDNEVNPDSTDSFEMYVTVNGIPLPVNYPYMIGSTQKQINTAGKIILKHGETATIGNLMDGSSYAVTEEDDSKAGYVVTYSGASGQITKNNISQATVKNEERTITPTMTVTKNIANPDEMQHTYAIEWWADENGNGTKEFTDANKQENISVKVNGNALSGVSDEIELKTVSSLDFATNEEPKVYYYQFKEAVEPDKLDEVAYDKAEYVVELTVSYDKTAGTFTETKEIYKDGEKLETQNSQVEFTNILLGTIELTKDLQLFEGSAYSDAFKMWLTITGDHIKEDMLINVNGTDYDYSQDQAYDKATLKNGELVIETDLKDAETLTVKKIPAGSTYTVTENGRGELGNQGFLVSYTVDGTASSRGTVPAKKAAADDIKSAATVTNKEQWAQWENEDGTDGIRVTKFITNPDGKDHTFKFLLKEVDQNGAPVSDGLTMEVPVTFQGDKGEVVIPVTYKTTDLNGGTIADETKSKYFYYEITEVAPDWKQSTHDSKRYTVTVLLTGRTDILTAKVTNITLNGQPVDVVNPGVNFTNTLLGSFTLEKRVMTLAGWASGFDFEITSDTLEGEYQAELNGKPTSVTFNNGVANVKLHNKDVLRVFEIPHGTEMTIKEYAFDFVIRHKINGGRTNTDDHTNQTITTDGVHILYLNYYDKGLPQTGQLNWPIPVLLGLGAVLIAGGIWLSRKKKKEEE